MSIMKSGIRKKVSIALGAVLLVAMAGLGYLALGLYYQEGFGVNTWINGIYCTGMTIEEVNAELLSRTEAPILIIREAGGSEEAIREAGDEEAIWEEGSEEAIREAGGKEAIREESGGEAIREEAVDLGECGYREDYTAALQSCLERRNFFLWLPDLFRGKKEFQLEPDFQVEEALLRRAWEETSFVTLEKSRETGVRLERTEEGYVLQDFKKHHLDIEAGYEKLLQAVSRGQGEVLLGEDCYGDLPYDGEEQGILALWDKLCVYQGCAVTYDMGAEQIRLGASELTDFLETDGEGLPLLGEDGRLQIREEKAEAFISGLLEEYNTMEKEREFQSTRGDLVTVPAGTYGTELDGEAERDYLRDVLQRCAESDRPFQETHVPAYRKEAYARGRNDIGDTYIEVDMTSQKLYFYSKGECVIDTDIVTGNTRRRMGTPEGVYYVYSKQRNRTLRGPGYASPVKYWMPVYKNIGIHDARWRAKFGGEIYKTNGSHGCINMPLDEAAELYDQAEIGMPVVIFY